MVTSPYEWKFSSGTITPGMIWLMLALWFWRRKGEKVNRQTDDRQSVLLTWAFSTDELKAWRSSHRILLFMIKDHSSPKYNFKGKSKLVWAFKYFQCPRYHKWGWTRFLHNWNPSLFPYLQVKSAHNMLKFSWNFERHRVEINHSSFHCR